MPMGLPYKVILYNGQIIKSGITDKNTIKKYAKTSFTRKIFHPSQIELNMFSNEDKFYGFFKSDNAKNKILKN